MIDWKVTQKKRILESVEKLQNIPVFTERQVNGLSLDWDKMKATKKVFTSTINEQTRSYKLRWLAEPLYCSMDSPRQSFYKSLTHCQEIFKEDQEVLEALVVIKKFLDGMKI